MMTVRLALLGCLAIATFPAKAETVQYFPVPEGDGPHDVAPAPDGTVWYTAQRGGALGRLDPKSGEVKRIPLGDSSSPHGVVVGPDGAPWVTDSGLNAIVHVDPATLKARIYPLPESSDYANLNTPTFGEDGILWFTGQNGIYGSVDPETGKVSVYEDPEGRGPYGITATPDGTVYYASLAGSHIARIDAETGKSTIIEPPTEDQGARRIWSDSKGRVWISEWNAGQVSVYDPAADKWQSWRLPGDDPQPYAVYVDDEDKVWLTDFGANAIVRFEPETETFKSFPSDRDEAEVRQLLGRPGEVWGAESGTDRLVVIKSE